MSSTPEEDKFFEEDKKAAVEETVEEAASEEGAASEEVAAEEAPEEGGDQAAASTEEAAEPDTEETETTAEGRQVPIGELFSERKKRQELQAKISQLEATFSKVMDRLNAPQQPQPTYSVPPPPDIPADDVDPVAHLKAKLDQLEMAAGSHTQVLAQQSALQQFTTALAGLENQFRVATPDYDAAVSFAKNARDQELTALGYDAAQRVELIRQEILGTSAAAMQRGQNPAEVFYAYAKVRGFDGNGAAGAAAAPAPRPSSAPQQAAAKLATVAKAQGVGKGMPRGGVAPPPEITLESLAKMEDKEFDLNFDRFFRKS